MSDGIVIAGGGLVAQRAAETLRREGYDGPLRMIAAERHLPYDRPPLSKQALRGEHEEERLAFRAASWYREQNVDLMLGLPATGLRAAERRLEIGARGSLRYERLLIATGSRPRRLPLLSGYENVHELRTVEDTRGLRAALAPGTRLAIVGAGFIGLEVAATARRLGIEVTIVEAASNPLAHVLGEQIGSWFAELHRAEGVAVLTGQTVSHVQGGARASALALSNGTLVEADEVLVGVGVEPDARWLAGSPFGSGGVPVDVNGRTVLPDVFAAGDVAATYDPLSARHRAGSHWEAAGRQARRAARLMLGLAPGEPELSSFWTDQYGIRIQYLGHAPLADRVTIDGELGERNFTATYMGAGKLVAALLVNRPRLLPALREQISQSFNPQGAQQA